MFTVVFILKITELLKEHKVIVLFLVLKKGRMKNNILPTGWEGGDRGRVGGE